MLRKLLWGSFLLCVLCACKEVDPPPPPQVSNPGQAHPFLIVREDQFDALRQKSGTEPWQSLKADAIDRSNAVGRLGNAPYDLQFFTGAAALAYILDEANAQKHADRVRDVILDKYSQLELSDGNGWQGVVPPMGSFFVAILSLDIVYNALTPAEVAACEAVIEDQISRISRSGSWITVRYGTHGTWDIYTGQRKEPDDAYYASVMNQITPDGVSPVTNHYAWERLSGGDSRLSKSGYMDVLEFTGIDQRYYQNERLKKFHRWLFGSSVNPAKEMSIIGDMLPTQGIGYYLLHNRVVNFDAEAASYAAWFHEGKETKGHILSYILPQSAFPAPVVPQSQIYPNGGAFFREQADDPDGFHAVLYNITSQDEWHTHQETNGLALSGYGNRLLVNGGRLGEPVRAAKLNNTLTLGGNDHQSRLGDGIIEGFTANELDYATGGDGSSIGNATHERSMILVHGADGADPYFLLVDEVEATPGEQIHTYLHPANQTSIDMQSATEEYLAPINHYPNVSGVSLSIFYATPPDAVNIDLVPSAVPDRYPNYPDHNRLEAIYPTDTAGKAHLLTVLFPYNASHPKASFSRIPDVGLSGGIIQHGVGIEDYARVVDEQQSFSQAGVSFQAQAVLYRMENGMLRFYFVRKGKQFSANGIGFDSDAPISIYARGNKGVIVSEGASLTLKGLGTPSLSFEPPLTAIGTSAGEIQVELPAGVVRFQ